MAFTSMANLLPFELDELEPGMAMPMSFFMINFLLIRGSWLDGEGLELMGPVSTAGLVGGAITKYHKKYNITPAGMECLLSAMQELGK
jgi:glycine cleavage system aminomethyltransferase T